MTMSNEDICKEFREAAVPTKQIAILADQNLCTKKEINVPKYYTEKQAPKKEAPPTKKTAEKAPDQTEEVYDGKGNVIIPVAEWIDILRMKVEFEFILSQQDAYGVLSAVETVKNIREARS